MPVKAQEAVAAVAASVADSAAVTAVVAGGDIVTALGREGATVTVEIPAALERRLENRALHSEPAETGEQAESGEAESEADKDADRPVQMSRGKVVGYRVQIYTDQNVRTGKSEARNRERMVGRSFPQYATYVSYSSPYWRLRVGDFRTQQEAQKAAAEIKRAFPRFSRDVRIVRDRINAR